MALDLKNGFLPFPSSNHVFFKCKNGGIMLKNTYRENIPSNKTEALAKSMKIRKYVYLGNWYPRSTIYEKFLYSNQIFRKMK